MPSQSDLNDAQNAAIGRMDSCDDTSFAIPEKPLILQNRYAIVRSLGQGGMGTVFLAQDKRLSDRFCVVKKLRLDGFGIEDKQKATSFFEREAMVLSSLKHPNVVSIQDYFQEHGNYFLVMEYVKGSNLQQLLKKRGEPFSEKQVTDWVLTILDVLHYLHSHNPPVIYRDIKPSNIMLGAVDGIKLVDFGIARPYAGHGENTHVVSGGYSPPEQYWGGADLRSDIYALGATMYFLLTGKEPVALQTCVIKQGRIVADHLDKVIQRATAQDIWLRHQSADEMRQVLIARSTQTQAKRLPNNALLIKALVAVAVACFGFLIFALTDKNNYLYQEASTLLSNGQDAKNKTEAENAVFRLPFAIATMVSSEENITDPAEINNSAKAQGLIKSKK